MSITAEYLFYATSMTEQFYVEVLTGTIFDAVKSADKRANGANWFGREKLVFLRTNKIATHKSHRLVTAYFLKMAANKDFVSFRVFRCYNKNP